MEDAVTEAQHIIDVSGANDRADVIAAFYTRLRLHKVPVAAAREFTMLEFYAYDQEWEDYE